MSSIVSAIGGFFQSLPSWIFALLVLAIGVAAAFLLRLIVSRALEVIRFNALCARIGLAEFLRKGQVRHEPSRLAGIIVYWAVLVVTFFQISRLLDIGVVQSFVAQLAASVPGMLAALFIVIIGLVIVSFVGNFVMTLARNAAYPHAKLLTRAVKIAGVVLVLGLALEQLNLSKTLISSMFQILFAAAALAVALAFGLGCKDLAREAMQRFLHNLREKGRTPKGPDLEG